MKRLKYIFRYLQIQGACRVLSNLTFTGKISKDRDYIIQQSSFDLYFKSFGYFYLTYNNMVRFLYDPERKSYSVYQMARQQIYDVEMAHQMPYSEYISIINALAKK